MPTNYDETLLERYQREALLYQQKDEKMELIETGWPLIELGYGLVEVAEGSHGEKEALIFGRNGSGKIGEPTKPDRVATHEETFAVVTFANVESLDVVLRKLQHIREKMVEKI